MGMAAGGGEGGAISEPNIVPLIDVLLVLIIIFMVITPTVPTGLPTLVPQPGFGAIETRTARSLYDRGAGDARWEADD
jgi:biopolymer transport protein ExbD